MVLNSVEEIIQDVRQGKMVVLMDDAEDKGNEGVLMMAAEHVAAEHVNFMARKARGLICLTLTEQRCKLLDLPPMVDDARGEKANFTLSIEAAVGVSSGISAADRARTVQAAVAHNAVAGDIVQPGHIFPLTAQPGGVLTRAGHTEAASDLARLAGLAPSAMIADIMTVEGELANAVDLQAFAKEHDLKIGTIADIIQFRVVNECTVKLIREGEIDTGYGNFQLRVYEDSLDGHIHLALYKGEINPEQPILVRVHVAAAVRDLLTTKIKGRKGWNIGKCLSRVATENHGVVVLLGGHETQQDVLTSVDISLGNAQVGGGAAGSRAVYMTVGLGSQILRDMGVGKIRLMGAPIRYNAISGFDLEVVEHIDAEE